MSACEHTPSPWIWCGNVKTRSIQLATPDRMRALIMDFHWPDRKRIGPLPIRFNDGGVMKPAGVFAAADHNGEFFEIDHPDARLIASAPVLLEKIRMALQELVPLPRLDQDSLSLEYSALDVRRHLEAAIAAAEGRS